MVTSDPHYPCNKYWSGKEIYLHINGKHHRTLDKGFREFTYCLSADDFNIKNDIVQLKSSNTNGVCISSLSINGKKILVGKVRKVLVGKNNDQSSFWIDGNQNRCHDDSMITSQITIQNGRVTSSECKGIISFDSKVVMGLLFTFLIVGFLQKRNPTAESNKLLILILIID